MDIHDPTNVTDASLVGVSGPSSYSAAASGEYAYVIGWYNGSYYLHVLYCVIPGSTSVLRTHDTTGFTYRVAIEDDYAYVADGGGLRVFGISAPGSSSEVASCTISGGIKSVAVHGPYAFVGGQISGFSVVDISDPSAVDNDSVATGLPSMYQAWDIKARGDLAFVADDQDGLIVIDISDPLNPLEVDKVLYGKECKDIALYGDYAYVATGFQGGIEVVNIDRTSADFLTTEVEYTITTDPMEYISANGITARGEYVYMAVSSEGLRNIYMSSDFTTVSEECTLAASDPQGLDVSGDYVFVADSTAGLKIIQVSDPAGPLLSGTCSTLSAWDVVVNGRYAYMVDGDWTAGNNKFRIIDLIPED